jgi:hypothetical protein
LNLFLPFSSAESDAFSIDAQGDIFGTALDSDGNIHAVEWSPDPEPSAFILAGLAALSLLALMRLRHEFSIICQ